MLRCDSRAVMACSFLRPNLVPCPTICTLCTHRGPAKHLIPVSSPRSIYFKNAFTFRCFRVMDGRTAQSAAPRRTSMTTFTINETNEIVAFSNQDEAAAATTTPFDSFSSQKELAEQIGRASYSER